jgi:hypothetical protein
MGLPMLAPKSSGSHVRRARLRRILLRKAPQLAALAKDGSAG